MKRRHSVLSILILVAVSVFADDQQYSDDQYPTAKISVLDQGHEGPSNRYALQVSGHQLQDYLKALRHVPDSVYASGAHIIADMDESALPESLTASRYESDSEGDEGRESVDVRSLIPAVRLDRHHYAGDQDRGQPDDRMELESGRRAFIYDPPEPIQRYERPEPLFKRPSARDLLRDLLMRREDIVKAEATPAVADHTIEEQITGHAKEAKAIHASDATVALKEKVVEALKQKEAEHNERKQIELSKDPVTSVSTPKISEAEMGKYKSDDEASEKYRAQESENKFKTHEKYKQEEHVIKQTGHHAAETNAQKDIASPELFMSRVQDELSKSIYNNRPAHYGRENRTDSIDMSTVRELLNTLIKQIEKIHSAARTLTAVTNAPDYETRKPSKDYQKDNYYPKHHQKEERAERQKKHRKPLPYDAGDSYHGAEVHVPKKPKRQPKERTVYLKPHEVMKLLEPEPFEHLELPVRRNRPYSAASSSVRRMHTPFPIRRTVYPPFYPGYKK